MDTPFDSQLYQIWHGNTYGDWLVFNGHQHFRPKGTGSQSSTIIVVPFYLCVGLPRLEVVSRRPLHVACAACAASPTLFYCPSAACETITSRQFFSTFWQGYHTIFSLLHVNTNFLRPLTSTRTIWHSNQISQGDRTIRGRVYWVDRSPQHYFLPKLFVGARFACSS